MVSYADKCAAFHRLHQDGSFVLPNAWDAGSARLMQSLGAKALGTTSAGHAWAAGRCDGLLSKDEVLSDAASIAEAVDIPVTGDLLNGFGNRPEDVAEAVRLAADIGLAGASIEDTTGDPDAPLYDRALALERIVAALEVAISLPNPFVLCARADAIFAGIPDHDEVLARLQAFDKAGAHLLYAPALMTEEQVERVLSRVSAPINVLAGIGNPLTVDGLAKLGVRRISVGSSLYGHAMGALRSATTELLGAGTFTWATHNMPYAKIQEIMNDT